MSSSPNTRGGFRSRAKKSGGQRDARGSRSESPARSAEQRDAHGARGGEHGGARPGSRDGLRSSSRSSGSRSGSSRSDGRERNRGSSDERGAVARTVVSHSRDAGRSSRAANRSEAEITQKLRRQDVDVPRIAALHTLLGVRLHDAFANLVLPQLLREHKLRGRDAAFATEIAYGALRTRGVLDAIIAKAAQRPLKDITPELLAVLELGAYQLLYTRVDDHAAVDTSVRMARGLGHDRATGFINGTLRTISRSTLEEWLDKAGPTMGIARTAFRAAHPTWIARSFAATLGDDGGEGGVDKPTADGAPAEPEELSAALEADSQRPIVHLVARPGQITAEELALISGGEQARFSPYGVYLLEGDPGDCEPVRQGLAAVQDEGSQLIARALTEAEVDGNDQGRWLDLCAGPGGKAAFIGSIAAIEGATVDAVEPAKHRAKLVRQAVDGLPVTVHVIDGREPGLRKGYDRILVDAPCSGLGSLRRRPEARWTKSESDLDGLTRLQSELLDTAIRFVRPGGIVVYSTCSPDLRETRAIVDAALNQHPELEEIDAHPLVTPMDNVGPHRSVQMWPHRHGTDAMFFAVLKKRS